MAKRPALISRSKNTVTITPAGRALIIGMASEGNDQRTIAKTLGIGQSTLTRCRERDPAVEDSWADGHAQLADEITHLLLQAGRKGNVIALIFLAKCRLNWIDQPKPDERPPSVVINLPASRSPEEYAKMIELQPVAQLPAPEEKSDIFGPRSKVIR